MENANRSLESRLAALVHPPCPPRLRGTTSPKSNPELSAMPTSKLWAATLSLLLIHQETACRHTALQAARLLDCLCDLEMDEQTRSLCERASLRLATGEKAYARAA